jgi:hypothetical protein
MVDTYDSIPLNIIELNVTTDAPLIDEVGYAFDGYTFVRSLDFYPRKFRFLMTLYDTIANYSDTTKIWQTIKTNYLNGYKKNLTLDNEIFQFNGSVFFTTTPVCIIYPNHIEIQTEFEEV